MYVCMYACMYVYIGDDTDEEEQAFSVCDVQSPDSSRARREIVGMRGGQQGRLKKRVFGRDSIRVVTAEGRWHFRQLWRRLDEL
jgi:hypothetical protein